MILGKAALVLLMQQVILFDGKFYKATLSIGDLIVFIKPSIMLNQKGRLSL